MGVDLDSSPERVALSSGSDRSDIGTTPPQKPKTTHFMESAGFDLLKLFPSVPTNSMKSAEIQQLFPSPPETTEFFFPVPLNDAVNMPDTILFPAVPSDEDDSSGFMDLEDFQEDSSEIMELFPSPPLDAVNFSGAPLNYDPEEIQFQEAVKNFTEEELIQYVRNGHRPPPGRAYKVRRHKEGDNQWNRSNKLERSLVVLASGTIFTTGKNQSVLEGSCSVPGGKLLDQGTFKRAFLVNDLNSGNKVVILVPKHKDRPETLLDMQKEDRITNQLALSDAAPYIVPVVYSSREDKPNRAYLESEYCAGGTLDQYPRLLENQIVGEAAKEAANAVRRAGFMHRDYNEGNFIFMEHPDEQNPDTLRLKLIDFGAAREATPEDPLDVWT